MKSYHVDKICIDDIDSNFSKAWLELVSNSPQASFFSQLHYLKVVRHTFERKIYLWYIQEAGKLKAGGVLLHHPTFRKLVSALFYVPYADILIRENPGEQLAMKNIRYNKILLSLREYLEANYYSVFLNLSPDILNVNEMVGNSTWNVNLRYTHYIYLQPFQKILTNIHRDERRQIKNFNTPHELTHTYHPDEFTDLIVYSYKRHQVYPPISRKLLSEWIRGLSTLKGIHFKGIRVENQKLVSGLLWAEFKDKAYFLLAGSKRSRGIAYSPYLYYKVMEELSGKKFRMVDLLGGSHHSITKFKIHMGAEAMPAYQLIYYRTLLLQPLFGIQSYLNRLKRKL